MKLKLLVGLSFLIVSTIFLTACEEDSDNEKLLACQECFNSLDDSIAGTGSAAAAATACSDKLGGLATEEAQLLRCGLKFWEGGLTTTTIVTAFDAYEAATEGQKEATLIDALALSSTGTADTAYSYCKSAGSAGMMYVAGLVKLGTYMEAAGGNTSADGIIDDCLADTTNCANAANGQMLIDVAAVYCTGESASNEVCKNLTTVINSSSDPATIIQNFLNAINY